MYGVIPSKEVIQNSVNSFEKNPIIDVTVADARFRVRWEIQEKFVTLLLTFGPLDHFLTPVVINEFLTVP